MFVNINESVIKQTLISLITVNPSCSPYTQKRRALIGYEESYFAVTRMIILIMQSLQSVRPTVKARESLLSKTYKALAKRALVCSIVLKSDE
jgi:hypothetical protein